MEIDRQYVDSHGQSGVAFAIHSQRLYWPDIGKIGLYKHLEPVMTRQIDWDLIRQQYDQMVKYATALRLGTAQTRIDSAPLHAQ